MLVYQVNQHKSAKQNRWNATFICGEWYLENISEIIVYIIDPCQSQTE